MGFLYPKATLILLKLSVPPKIPNSYLQCFCFLTYDWLSKCITQLMYQQKGVSVTPDNNSDSEGHKFIFFTGSPRVPRLRVYRDWHSTLRTMRYCLQQTPLDCDDHLRDRNCSRFPRVRSARYCVPADSCWSGPDGGSRTETVNNTDFWHVAISPYIWIPTG